MYNFVLFLVLNLVIAACSNSTSEDKKATGNQQPGTEMNLNELTDTQKAEGWQLLFDGNSTSGWHKYGGKPVGNAWKIANGELYLDTASKENWQIKDGGDIITDEEFENYHLKLEWKISPNGNSGIIFNIHEDTALYQWPWMTGPEMQVLDNNGHADSKITKHRAGDLYDLISCSQETVKPAGEWNKAEIKLDKGKLDFFLNGENVVSTTMWDDNWNKMVGGSKFKQWPGFGTYKKGKIGLQDHGDMVWYRNIMIRKL